MASLIRGVISRAWPVVFQCLCVCVTYMLLIGCAMSYAGILLIADSMRSLMRVVCKVLTCSNDCVSHSAESAHNQE